MNRSRYIYIVLLLSLLTSCASSQRMKGSVDLGQWIQPVPRHAVLEHEDYWVWGASMTQTDDGVCHLFYSRWPKSGPFSDWLYHSEIAYATSKNPGGPYTFKKVILKDGQSGKWGHGMAHNPHIRKFGDKYFLYFISTENVDASMANDRQRRTFAQRIGVAVADAPDQEWRVVDTPIVGIQAGKAAHGYVTNPSVCQRPDGSFLMIFKSRPANWATFKKFTSIQCVATAPSPAGPFTIAEKPILADATAEDPFLFFWRNAYYAILDDQYGDYSGEHGLVLFRSDDGFNWKPSANARVAGLNLKWQDTGTTQLKHLERPQLWMNKKNEPAILFCAAMTEDEKGVQRSFNVHIPLKNIDKRAK
ncbi:glycoside hydrolase family protein [Niabella insulamsoli]|uniref:glycoside hydrolase family protein n=1 Tax=Niabella insulamsoli TaxID=3144874 RepID=UPI0031FDBFAA